jgi:hypothetical protein
VPGLGAAPLAIGGIACALSVLTDFTVVLGLRGMTLEDYVARFDPVSGTAFWIMQVVFALMPWWLAVGSGRGTR